MKQHVSLAAGMFLLFFVPVVTGQETVKLTLPQRELVLTLIENSPSYKVKPTDKHVLCEITARRITAEDGAKSVIVTTYHFDYRDGHTVRSIANLSTEQSESVRLEGYTPPLAAGERLRAMEIALENLPEVRALYDGGAEPETSFMPSVVVDKEHELFGHRIVEIQLVLRRGETSCQTTALVDLTTGTVLDPNKRTAHGTPQATAADVHQVAIIDNSATVEHLFPLGAAAAEQETGWRVTFGIETHGAGEILYIKEAYFRRTNDDGWFHVLGDCRLAEMFVPYNNGFTRYYDITSVGGNLVRLHDNDFGPRCLGAPKRYLDDKVALEFHDSRTLWMDHRQAPNQRSRRGEEMHIWSVLPTGNYAYPMLYTFRSDGSVGFYVSATAHNLVNTKDDSSATHLHMGCWRLNVVLGDQSMNSIETVRFDSSEAMGAKATTVVDPFNGGVEGGIVWTPDDFLRLRVTNNVAVNTHAPPAKVGYELLPNIRQGNGRTYGVGEEWNHKDLWVTLPTSITGALQDRYRELPLYVNSPRTFENQPAVIWCQATLVHRARDEDFGKQGYDASDGVALTSWTGYDLVPRNLFAKTPLYRR